MDWDAELIALMAEFGGIQLARHAHLPLQSGSDSVLRRMHRRYRPWHYADKVSALTAAPPAPRSPSAPTSWSDSQAKPIANSRRPTTSFACLPFGYLHLFPFSPRPGTRAWTLHAESPVAATVVNERMTAPPLAGRRKDACTPAPVHRDRTRRHHPAHTAGSHFERPDFRAH